MNNINIERFEDNTFAIEVGNPDSWVKHQLKLQWNSDKNQWVTVSDTPEFNNSFGDGPLPDWTSLIQFLLEYND